MQKRRNALGRGLDSLISPVMVEPQGASAINDIDLELIYPNPEQPRTTFDEELLEELTTSIREFGIIQPLSLRKLADGTYQIIAGERRWRAAKAAGLSRVPAYVRTADDSEITEMALIENIQRQDLNAIEVALAFRKLIDTYSLTQERLSERLGKKRATIANHLRLLKLPAEIQLGLRDKKLEMGHARALLSIEDPKSQLKLYNKIVKDGLSVRRVEEMVRGMQGGEPMASNSKGNETRIAADAEFARELSKYFPRPVKFKRGAGGKGSITLNFTNDDELRQIIEMFSRLEQ